jgi:hypothetical protein
MNKNNSYDDTIVNRLIETENNNQLNLSNNLKEIYEDIKKNCESFKKIVYKDLEIIEDKIVIFLNKGNF